MSHEPECAFTGETLPDDPCPTCNLIRIGYKRGREDAAKAVIAVTIATHHGSASLSETVAAARGETIIHCPECDRQCATTADADACARADKAQHDADRPYDSDQADH